MIERENEGDTLKLFGKAKEIEKNIEKFLTSIIDASTIFESSIELYLQGEIELFEKQLALIDSIEHEADMINREINYWLYTKMLIPESRSDILSLLESSDDTIDAVKSILTHISIEIPEIPEELHSKVLQLTKMSSKALVFLKYAIEAFFNNDSSIKEYIQKIQGYEVEGDAIEDEIKKIIFQSGIVSDLAKKTQLRDIMTQISLLADKAEDVADMLSIYSIKRSI